MKTQFTTLSPLECDHFLRYLQQPHDRIVPPRVSHRNYTMALIMLDTGARVGELIQLRQDQLWFTNVPVGALTIEKDQAKNKSERTIPTTMRLRQAIEQMHRQWWINTTQSNECFAFYTNLAATHVTTRQVQRIIKSAGKLSIGREIHPHLLRHTFATRLMTKAPMRVVQELLGHVSITSTQIYTHPNQQDKQKAIDSLNQKE